MGCYNRKSFLQYNNSNNRGRQHFGWPATDDGPWLPPSMAATTIQRGHLRHVFLLRMIANRLEGGMDTLAAATTSIVWDGLLQQQIVPAIQQQQQQREAAFVMASHRRWSMAATTIQRGYLRHVFLRKFDANNTQLYTTTLSCPHQCPRSSHSAWECQWCISTFWHCK